MNQYKSHPIYGIAIPGLAKAWHCRGLIFDPDDQVTEIKRLDCAELAFATKKQAEQHGLDLCKKWLDDQFGRTESSSPTSSAPMKACPVVF
jgi:hypothetical protein